MASSFISDRQKNAYNSVISELGSMGYGQGLLVKDYKFSDWFAASLPERHTHAAAFGQFPASYETACIAVVLSGGERGESLIRQYRALGAPLAFEIRDDVVVKWSIGADTVREDFEFSPYSIKDVFRDHDSDWSRAEVMRAKNIGARRAGGSDLQLDLFLDTGLIQALESEIQNRLDPLLHRALGRAVELHLKETGEKPDAVALFQIAFRLLAGKVFFDRGLKEVTGLGSDPGPNVIIEAISKHYSRRPKSQLTQGVRQAIYDEIWTNFDFRNLSVEVLAQIWSTTFVDPETRKKLGIHRTRRAIANYVVDRLPFENVPENERFVVEPCSGGGAFLIAALHRMRDLLPPAMSGSQRHDYLRRHLFGFESESFGIEVAWLCLTLADFPNPNGWNLTQEDVFKSPLFQKRLSQARFVLCNPPFEAFSDPTQYDVEVHASQPVELLTRTLDMLHPSGSIGFILPHAAIDGRSYKRVRERIAQRFSNIEIVSLPPESAFDTARHPTVLLLAHGSKDESSTAKILHRKVQKNDWHQFTNNYKATREDVSQRSVSEATESLRVPDLADIWRCLSSLPRLHEVADVHRGIEWDKPLRDSGYETGNREQLVKSLPQGDDFRLGLPPLARPFYAFEIPEAKYLSVRPEDRRRNAFDLPWDKPKIFLNAVRKSQRAWRLAAASDFEGLLCYQTFVAIWPYNSDQTIALAAVLNGPVANAFLATHEEKHNRNDSIKSIPVPDLSLFDIAEINSLVGRYQREVDITKRDLLLRKVDAAVMSAYDLHPKRERELLDFFNGAERQVPFPFADYYPPDFTPAFSLTTYLSDTVNRAGVKDFIEECRDAPEAFREAVQLAAREFGEDSL